MYDVTQEHTFLAVREWIDSIRETIGVMPPSLLLLGNKLDCVHTASDRGVSFEAGETMAKIFGAKFMEVSAKTGQNVADAFYTVARLVFAYYMTHKALLLQDYLSTETSPSTSP